MTAVNLAELILTCKDRAEAEKITDCLLEKQLIACAKFVTIDSRYRWNGKIAEDQEVMVLMESKLDNFSQIEAEIDSLHSYETFVLKAVPVQSISTDAEKWLKSELK